MAVTGYFLDREWEYQEILLGFVPLSGVHSGVNLSDVVLKILHQHQITNRVLAITTDNTSNNNTMISSIQESIQSLELNINSNIIRLSLKDLLGQMEANPKNEIAEMQWPEDRMGPIHATDQQRMIVDTLNKVRNLAVYINASPQRREAFCNLQAEGPKLVPIQDVRTPWNSAFLRLRRAKKLQSAFDDFVHIFSIYNKLFGHLEKSISQLKRKKVPWKKQRGSFHNTMLLLRADPNINSSGYASRDPHIGKYLLPQAVDTLFPIRHLPYLNMKLSPTPEICSATPLIHKAGLTRNTLHIILIATTQKMFPLDKPSNLFAFILTGNGELGVCIIAFVLLFIALLAQLLLVIYRNGIFSSGGFPRALISCSRLGKDDSNILIQVRIALTRPMKTEGGQYINLRIPSVSWWSWAQVPPYIVTSWSHRPQETLDLQIQPRRGFSGDLLKHALAASPRSASFLALIIGPHGLSENVDRYESVMLVTNGFGIAAAIPYLKKLIYSYNTSASRTWNPFGNHNRAVVYSGYANYDQILRAEMSGELIERLPNAREEKRESLVMVAASNPVRDQVQTILRDYVHQKVKIAVLEYQP
ncbi:hypothetical protein TSTA_012280 [Talaromyces stipitatus ATCC 10500]|uniref:Uncharacterized protein n=1 Tax=Talaromyces stipitatus (strain ATCC 10500 / CBS 375.48 / QM 6759 / NRRL 1006) TaxID=441959 RepID=B8ME42_TALSN|nr:uncharacterized protein TSTA_012280 [Talaromyces stipitatus ATCC 10500]EED16119.1 hypothetical protein TSTA_012280 [Talaromyces stipitatus ATCC 10500]